MTLLIRTSIARTLSICVAGPSKVAFSTISPRYIADNKNDASPARDHHPRSAAGPNSAGQTSSWVLSKQEKFGVDSTTSAPPPGKTQLDAINSAMGVLDNLARDVAGSNASSPSVSVATSPLGETNASNLTASSFSPISTPSSPSLVAVHESGSGPIYSASMLPPKSDPTLEFLTNLLMKDGKKAQAQRFTTRTLSIISIITNSNPLPLIHDAISRTAPLVKLQSKKQGGKTLQVPVALTQRQSTRKALTWIIDASKKRPDRELEKRLAAEFLAVVEGTSNAIAKKEEQHRVATVNRANAAVRI
ncbi:related to RSM7 - mitochondrial ribosomal protein, small subunit [Melanopsichium pennsylvanicum]|uniref:Related to RSM7 - mitochondrial ribosomal protein, small subunit n=2 Tax=Melanopsichium pennsylvanicum TaxID=63383 RepID=A0AAJ4XPI8_9BASI|nr:related to RSM7-mitochondrial ribosomal protein, small subunit [Melanopsichium pennsylvanicum 4]SNX85953.1 related to RSM7 - mitochondrial ribosomal protein, small subunit [Melanopsichium pennsylvanicum]